MVLLMAPNSSADNSPKRFSKKDIFNAYQGLISLSCKRKEFLRPRCRAGDP